MLEDVLHRDLHSKNILIHNNNAKITDFGISKFGNNSTTHIGPCDKNSATICAIIINNKARENTIPDTPIDYENLYKKCWDQEPEQRPTITEILEEFSRMSFINKPIKMNINMIELINNKLNNKVKIIHFNELIELKPLDEGAFGSIIKATWSKTNNYIVCKKLKTQMFKRDDEILSAFIYELKIHLHLNHSNRIIRFLGISQEPDQRPIIKEVLEKFLKMGCGKEVDVETAKNIDVNTNNLKEEEVLDNRNSDSVGDIHLDTYADLSATQQLDFPPAILAACVEVNVQLKLVKTLIKRWKLNLKTI
ncbi:15233_t:CDS:2 [Funneliformis mosseae]|uniref:15233_t:CDS:1 n=1 Tax=Funneliformis mosseae TaxID=27381 RepID=A0A9N8WBF1_FUNMO|nr:15233_t:CDS:2 [Funneliformis mosseae]